MLRGKNFSSNYIIHESKNGIEYLKFSALEKYSDKINHCITLRYGGISQFPVDSLNFRIAGNDKKENVIKNLKRVCSVIQVPYESIFKAKQAHTDNILNVTDDIKYEYKFENVSSKEYDGYICNEKNIATLVTTADCNPIIIYDPKQNVYANVHSGWKGTIKKIYMKAAKIMHEDYFSNYSDMIVCIGPSIKKCCFSSEDENFKKIFTNIWKEENKYIYYEKNLKRFHIDLGYVIKSDLLELGIKSENIINPNICTKCNSKEFFSYREATNNNYSDYGTMATIVNLK